MLLVHMDAHPNLQKNNAQANQANITRNHQIFQIHNLIPIPTAIKTIEMLVIIQSKYQ